MWVKREIKYIQYYSLRLAYLFTKRKDVARAMRTIKKALKSEFGKLPEECSPDDLAFTTPKPEEKIKK